jgi:predicted DNA binding CopG/RHH family protein
MKTKQRKSRPFIDEPLDDEEREIMEAERAGKLKPIPRKEFEALKKKLIQAAKNSIAARKMISIKVRVDDLDVFKEEAERKGLKYQALINSVLHQYATGHLKPQEKTER